MGIEEKNIQRMSFVVSMWKNLLALTSFLNAFGVGVLRVGYGDCKQKNQENVFCNKNVGKTLRLASLHLNLNGKVCPTWRQARIFVT
jgi:hypothetical protein